MRGGEEGKKERRWGSHQEEDEEKEKANAFRSGDWLLNGEKAANLRRTLNFQPVIKEIDEDLASTVAIIYLSLLEEA